MKNNNTKVISGISAVLMCAALFAGCSSKTENKPFTVQAETLASADVTTAAETEKAASEGYKVIVNDQNGAPVKGVTIQFCSDDQCVLGNTDAKGETVFDFPEGKYIVHILAVPEGFEDDENEYTAAGSVTEITLKSSSTAKSDEDDYTWDLPAYGFKVFMCPEYRPDNLKGILTFDGRKLKDDPYICYFSMGYYAVADEDIELFDEYSDKWMDAMMNDEPAPKAPRKGWEDWTHNITSDIFSIYNIDSSRTEDELISIINESLSSSAVASCEKICTKGHTDFYLVQTDDVEKNAENHKENMGDFYDEFVRISTDKDTFLSCFTFSEPRPDELKTVKAGDVISFETTDLDGNTVSSKELFGENKVTMINVWGTYCGPCKKELPELGEMAEEFKAKDCAIIGLVCDGNKEEKVDKAIEILSENGCGYKNIIPSDDMAFLNNVTSVPCTIFVNSDGVVLTDPILGAKVDQYPVTIDECLAAME